MSTQPARSAVRTIGRFALAAALVLACTYLLAVVAACSFQRNLLYFPDPRELSPPASAPPVQVVRLETRDHEHLLAWFLPPQPGKPVLLYFGGNGDALVGEAGRLALIAHTGDGALIVAYRGYSGSSGHPTEAGLHLDADAAYAWLAARYPPGRIVIYGHSLGAGVAVRLAAEHPARALILESPFTSAIDVGELRLSWLPVRFLMWDRFESAVWIGKVRMPVLVVHGEDDAVIPIAQGRRLYGLANAPKAFVAIPGAGHNDLPEHGVYDVVWRFLSDHPSA